EGYRTTASWRDVSVALMAAPGLRGDALRPASPCGDCAGRRAPLSKTRSAREGRSASNCTCSAGSALRADLGQRLELLFGVAGKQYTIVAALEAVERDGDFLLAHTQESACTYKQVHGTTVGRNDHVLDVAHFLIVLIEDALAHDVVLGAPAGNRFRGGGGVALPGGAGHRAGVVARGRAGGARHGRRSGGVRRHGARCARRGGA